MSGFHRAFATGVACQQGTLTLPDTWFRPPFWDLLMLQLLRPNSSNLPCLYSTFHLEYPLVLSRFCLLCKYSAVIQVKHLFLHSHKSKNSILVCLNKIYFINRFRQFCFMYRNEILTLSELINIHVKGVVYKMRDI